MFAITQWPPYCSFLLLVCMFWKEPVVEQEKIESHGDTSLPVLCIEDGMVILRFSEIFGRHEPARKPERKVHQKRPIGNSL